MKRLFPLLVCCCWVVLLFASCRKQPPAVPRPAPSVYYWRTVLTFSPEERAFLRRHHIGKVYLRYFDVAPDQTTDEPVPVATLQWRDSVPGGIEIVPVVFIVNSCLDAAPASLDTLADRIARRVEQMSITNDCDSRVREVQIDCDWTARTASAYFAFLRRLRTTLTAHGLGLSATIRLHQLSQAAPPVDYGVLMLYNTGDPRDVHNPNPILRLRDVKPFVGGIADYPLPLCAAYPDYHWQRLVGGGRYKGLLYAERLDDSTVYRRVRPDAYVVISSRYVSPVVGGSRESDVLLVPGDSVFVHDSRLDEIRAVRAELSRRRPDLHRQVILYPLDTKNIQRHTSSRYEEIYRP